MTDKTVLVTGASGYIAAHVVARLQREGYRVRGTVRSLANAAKTEPLRRLVPEAPWPLELVEADLEKDEGWDEAVSGCWAVLHTASPVPDIFTGYQEPGSVVGPALRGTRRVLEAVVRNGVKRVVLTSSVAAIIGGYKGFISEGELTEENWTDPEGADVSEYSKSKVLAEKEAWQILEDTPEEKKFSLSVINPVLVLGPPLLPANGAATTVGLVTKIITRESFIFPDVYLPICDVRDVAEAHFKALTLETAAGHRHIIAHEKEISMPALADLVSGELTPFDYRIPTWRLPYWVVYLASFFFTKAMELNHVWGRKYYLSNKRMKEVLGVQPIPVAQTIHDMIEAVIDMGIVPKTEKYKTSKS